MKGLLTTFLADTELDLEELDSGMKTTPEGLTHLINMLVDVVNLQRKALGTPGANCDVELDFAEVAGKVTVKFYADVDIAAAPPPVTLEQFGGKGDRMLTPADVIAAEMALVESGYNDADANGLSVATSREAVRAVFDAVGVEMPDPGLVQAARALRPADEPLA